MMITVKYWRGTLQVTGKARSYAGAMRIASLNQNAYSPTFWDGNRQLIDDGNGLAYRDEVEQETGSVVVRQYAVFA
jgi:hypothetical protein